MLRRVARGRVARPYRVPTRAGSDVWRAKHVHVHMSKCVVSVTVNQKQTILCARLRVAIAIPPAFFVLVPSCTWMEPPEDCCLNYGLGHSY